MLNNRSLWKEKLVPYIFITPFILAFLIFFFAPAIYSLVLSFYQYRGYGKMKFLGFQNYQKLFTYSVFYASLRNTLFYFICHTIPTMILAFVFAFMLQSKLMSGPQRIFKPVLFLPQIVPIVATSLMWKVLLAKDSGAFNQIFGTSIDFLSASSDIRKWSVVMMMTWRATGWYMVIYLAGLTSIGDEIYDAALIDGANVMQRIFRITLPMMKPIFLFAFIMDAIGGIKLYTEPNVLLTGSTSFVNEPNAMTMMNVLVMNMNGANFGMSAAMGWIVFLLVLLISGIQFKILGNREDQ